MKSSQKEIIIDHSANDLYEIVLDIEKYPEFIPWCSKILIKSKKKDEIFADMIVTYKLFLPQKFTSHVIYNAKKLLISTEYIDGPLKDLKTHWNFKKISDKKTKVIFNINFEFKKFLHQKLVEIFFNLIETKMIDSFKKRADELLD
tara:strand:+ start:928 stop:1365 length:438 start_codon:yes stop_codon:yes gene_type:complete